MPLHTQFTAAATLALCLSAGTVLTPHSELFRYNYENIVGTSLELKIAAATEAQADLAAIAALNEIGREAKILSGYDPTSEFSLWNKTQGQPIPVSPELAEVLSLFDQWRDRTHGALDPAAETITRVWKSAAKLNRLPTPAELANAVALVAQPHWKLAQTTATRLSTAPIVLNSLAKSYIVDKAADAVLASPGVSAAVVNIGGDLAIRGRLSERVAVADPKSDAENADPLDTLLLTGRAIATSGNYRRGVEIAGRHYSHIVDPRTGLPAESVISSTVVAPRAADAGALATAFSVLPIHESRKLAASTPGVEYLLIAANGNRIQSPGWAALAIPGVRPFVPAAAAPAAWDPSMELTIHIELAQINDARARRPYLAAWIEDKDKFPVRTLALWYQKPRWLPDLKTWYRDDRLRQMAEGSDLTASLSSATRPAGKYSLKWDGKDNAGKFVKPGKYRVMIEAAREHGTYQLLQEELDFSGAPKQLDLPGGTEIAAASLDYHKTSK